MEGDNHAPTLRLVKMICFSIVKLVSDLEITNQNTFLKRYVQQRLIQFKVNPNLP